MPRIPVESDVPIYFASTFEPEDWSSRTSPTLVLAPFNAGWNDFGLKFRVAMYFVGFQEELSLLQMRVMFDGGAPVEDKFQELHGQLAGEVTDRFVSVFAEPEGYRILVERLGFEDAFGSLRRANDVVVARLEEDRTILDLATGLNFISGVLREDSTWAAVRSGGRYLTPHPARDVEDAAQSFAVSAKLNGFSGRHRLKADFGTDFPLSRRMLVLVGENGAGKSQLFSAIIRGLQSPPRWENSEARPKVKFKTMPQFSRLVVFSSAASDPYPSAVPPWRGIDYRFHRMIGRAIEDDDDLAESLQDVARAVDFDGVSAAQRMELLREVLVPLDISDDLCVEVSAGGGQDRLPRPTEVEGRYYVPFFGRYGEEQRLQLQARMIPGRPPQVLISAGTRALSSGEQVLLRFATQAIGSLQPGTMYFFDEPETHLHPRYVSLLMSMLDRLLELSHSIALIATHSAYIVREVPARRVQVIRREEDGEISLQRPRLQTFGASTDRISQFVFGDLAIPHRFEKLLEDWLELHPQATLDEFREMFREDLNVETLSFVAQRLEEKGRQ